MPRAWWMTAGLLGSSLATLLIARAPASAPEAHAVGSAACEECHEREFRVWRAGGHGRLGADSTLVAGSAECEACHGPGSAHVEADNDRDHPGFSTMRSFKTMKVEEANALCSSCHNGGEQFYWEHSSHGRQDVACTNCHSMHDAHDPGMKHLLKTESASGTCLTCHREKRMSVNKSAHMPLREGGMECTSCHNPHGTATENQLRASSNNELCESCHADKRGPTLWEHAPVRENCVTCHEPHGSNNDKVLQGKRPYLCQRCHIFTRHPSSLYDAADLNSNRLFNRSCTNCHMQVHGSNHPSGKFFLR